MLPGAGEVHAFWFGDVTDWAACARRNNARWFQRGRALDAPVRLGYAALADAAGDGGCEHWLATPRGALALVITLDQLPRHLHRGHARAFARDGQARAACEAGIARGHDRALSPLERSFFYLPLEHAEDAAAQARCVRLMERAAEGCDPALEAFMAEAVHHARLHRDIVERFGRFPHRNAALGRESSAQERAWLASGASRFGQ